MKNLEIKSVLISVLIVFVLLIIIPILLLFTIDSLAFDNQPSFRGDYKVYGDNYLKQDIYPNRNNLRAIGISVKNPNMLNKNDLIIEVIDKNNNKVRKVVKSGLNIFAGSLVKFDFDPILDSKDKKYTLHIYSPESEEFESFSLFITRDKSELIGDLTINDNLSDEKIALQLFYKPEKNSQLIGEVYLNYFNTIVEDRAFIFFYLFIVLLTSYLFLKGRKRKKQYGKNK